MKLLNILLANLKQGARNKHLNIFSLNSKFCINILQILLRLNYIQNFIIINKKLIKIYLKYFNNQCVFTNVVKISKGGCRVY
jgi:ribosomal protein S8